MTQRRAPRYGRHILLSMALAIGVYVVVGRLLDRQGLMLASTVFAVTISIIAIVYRILDTRHQRLIKAGLVDPGPTVAEFFRRLRRRRQP